MSPVFRHGNAVLNGPTLPKNARPTQRSAAKLLSTPVSFFCQSVNTQQNTTCVQQRLHHFDIISPQSADPPTVSLAHPPAYARSRIHVVSPQR